MFKKLFSTIRKKVTTKHVVIAGAFVLALSGAVGAGVLAKHQGTASASGGRDCSYNSIDMGDWNGGCGAMSPQEWVADLQINQPGDLQASAAAFGTDPSEYARFASTARFGTALRDGSVWVDDQIIMTDSWSIGRDYKANAWNVYGYWANYAWDVFRGNSIPVMVMFDANGNPETIVMTPCGNLVWGTPVLNGYSCDLLNMTPVAGKRNTYNFTANISTAGNARFGGVTYDFGDGTYATSTTPSVPVQHTYTKEGNFVAKVTGAVALPGGQSTTFTSVQCQKPVTVVLPTYVCTGLVAKALDEEMQNFRFTAKFKYANGPTPLSADFKIDNDEKVNTFKKDDTGSYYYDAKFTDDKEHVVHAYVHFELDGKKVTTTQDCIAKVTSKKTPMCAVPGKEQYPPNSPQCLECKPGIPRGDSRCNPKELPNTGMGNVAGLFVGTSALGAAGHQLLSRRRRS